MILNREDKMKEIEERERACREVWLEDETRLAFHLMPPAGWLNDPNGLCQMNGIYHVFFQYSPLRVEGGEQFWGHYTSEDLLHWHYQGIPLMPDHEMDQSGVYSGSALVEDGVMHLYYTGNVKEPGDFDYILDGREANVVHVSSADGIHVSEKELILDRRDYPETYSRHIRDPKVWKENGVFYMALGGRRKNDWGAVLLYRSADRQNWKLEREWTTAKPMGYMWECPDCFELDGLRVLSISPQGVKREEFRMQNIYQQGYFVMSDWNLDRVESEFKEWDMGFDFYAPQTFLDESGRRILIGWVGVPDMEAEYHNRPTIEKGWQHALTLPREITSHEGMLYQYPVKELEQLRGHRVPVGDRTSAEVKEGLFDLQLNALEGKEFSVSLAEELNIHYANGVFELSFSGEAGCGRTSRKALIQTVEEMRIVADTTLVEVYLNHGEYVFTTRYYPKGKSRSVVIACDGCDGSLWELKDMEVDFPKKVC